MSATDDSGSENRSGIGHFNSEAPHPVLLDKQSGAPQALTLDGLCETPHTILLYEVIESANAR